MTKSVCVCDLLPPSRHHSSVLLCFFLSAEALNKPFLLFSLEFRLCCGGFLLFFLKTKTDPWNYSPQVKRKHTSLKTLWGLDQQMDSSHRDQKESRPPLSSFTLASEFEERLARFFLIQMSENSKLIQKSLL